MKITLEVLPSILIVSKYLICMAASESKISAASLINFAALTSACALITLLSANLLSLAAADKAMFRSFCKTMSLIYMF